MNDYINAALGINHLLRMKAMKKRIVKIRGNLEVEAKVTDSPIPFYERLDLEYEKKQRRDKIGALGGGAWLHLTGAIPEGMEKDNAFIWLDTRGEGALFDDTGSPVVGLNILGSLLDAFSIIFTKKSFAIPPQSFEANKIDLWVETANNGFMGKSYGPSRLMKYAFFSIDKELRDFYYDYVTLYFVMRSTDNKADKDALSKALDSAYKIYPKALDEARKILLTELAKESESDITVTAIGHSHLDVVWLWRLRETVRKAGRTFSSQLNNIEAYPDYIFGASQPLEYQFVKENYPSLYARIKKAVAEGRIEPLGGMWIEPDTNLSNGESLIRQIYFGKKFFTEEFGAVPKVCWLPDAFGYSGALPQILKKTGMDYFITIKLNWNKVNKFPYTTFNWKGIDGSEVLTHMPPEGNYGSDIAPYSLKKAIRQNKDDPRIVKSFLVPFGCSDGGGGAGEGHMEILKREASLKGLPKIKQQSVDKFFTGLDAVKEKLPVYNGELYLETHQGTYTTQANQKKYNRKSENLLHNMEAIGALALKKGIPYEFAKAEELWKSALLEQFHDILPGSSTDEAHAESIVRYKKFLPQIEKYTTDMQTKLKTNNDKLSALNLSPAPQKGYFHTGNGWVYVDLQPYSAKAIAYEPFNNKELSFNGESMQNDILSVTFGSDGSIISLVDRFTNKEYNKNGLNKLTIYKDKREWYNAWNIDYNYYNKKSYGIKLKSSTSYVDGAMVVRKNVYAFNKSRLVQKVILKLNCPYVIFETTVEWHETYKMLRADFFPAEYGDNAVCDIQFGNIARTTKQDSDIGRGQLEICAQKYLDVSNANYGTAVVTHSKYGYRAKDGLISLNLLRSPRFPAPNADRGTHKFSYAYYPHNGSTFDSDIISIGYNFNNPIIFVKGELSFKSLAKTEDQNIIIETIKPAENGGYIIRAYETTGQETKTAISVDLPYIYTFACDMLENPLEKIKLDSLTFKPYEIKTILLK